MKQALELSQEKNLLLFQVESQMFGFDHARLGGMLLNEWKLPKKLVQCAFYHHKPSRAFEYPEEAAVIHAADVIANAVQYGSSGERLVPPLSADAWKIIGLPDSIIPTVLEELHKQYEGAVEFILGDQE